MYKNDKVIRRYSEPFKLKILDEITTGKLNKNQLGKLYGIAPTTINEWIKKYERKDLMNTRVKVETKETMRKLLLLITLILPLTIFGQDSYLANLPISGAISEIGVSPSEKIWLATKAGNTYYTDKIGELWSFGPFGTKDPLSMDFGGTFERVNFFSEKIMMISGYIHGENSNTDFVYRSEDGGLNWDKVKFGKSSWIDAAYINDNGKAWMSGNSQLIYYSEDYGETWKSFDKAGNENALRFATIHFAKDEKTGLFGSFWNVLYKTTDNCEVIVFPKYFGETIPKCQFFITNSNIIFFKYYLLVEPCWN